MKHVHEPIPVVPDGPWQRAKAWLSRRFGWRLLVRWRIARPEER